MELVPWMPKHAHAQSTLLTYCALVMTLYRVSLVTRISYSTMSWEGTLQAGNPTTHSVHRRGSGPCVRRAEGRCVGHRSVRRAEGRCLRDGLGAGRPCCLRRKSMLTQHYEPISRKFPQSCLVITRLCRNNTAHLLCTGHDVVCVVWLVTRMGCDGYAR